MPWGVNVPALRKWMGLTVADFAELFQVGESTVYRWETPGSPTPDKLYRSLLTVAEDMRLRRKRKEMAEVVSMLRRRGSLAGLAVLLRN